MKHKRELALFLGFVHYPFNPKFDTDWFLKILSDYEQNHEGLTITRQGVEDKK